MLVPLPWVAVNDYQRYLLDLILINVILAVGLNIVKGFAGQVTVGHIALMAIGAYTSAVLTTKFGVPFWFALPGAMLVTALRRRDRRHPVVPTRRARTSRSRRSGLAESVRIFISATDYLGASVGYSDIPPPNLFGYSAQYVPQLLLRRHAAGRCRRLLLVLHAALEHRPRVQGAARGPAGGGGLPASTCASTSRSRSSSARSTRAAPAASPPTCRPDSCIPNSYTVVEMVTVLLMVVLGGIGHVWGGIIGAIIVTIIYDLTREYYEYQLLMFGFVIVLTVMFMPTGIGGMIDRYLVNARLRGDSEGEEGCCLRSPDSRSTSAASSPCRTSISISRKARSAASSGRTVRARARCST